MEPFIIITIVGKHVIIITMASFPSAKFSVVSAKLDPDQRDLRNTFPS
jgi:hypothetical protein